MLYQITINPDRMDWVKTKERWHQTGRIIKSGLHRVHASPRPGCGVVRLVVEAVIEIIISIICSTLGLLTFLDLHLLCP